MMKTVVSAISLVLGMGAPAIAQQTPTPVMEANVPNSGGAADTEIALFKNGKTMETVTCSDFLGSDVNVYPQAISYAANYGPKGKAHPTETVSGVETMVPAVVDACKARPGNRFDRTVKAVLKQQGK